MRLPCVSVSGLSLLAALCLGSSLPAHADIVVFSQPTDLLSSQASQNDTSAGGLGNYSTVYDNFSLPAGTPITGVQWVGAFFNPSSVGSITGFTLSFYNNAGNAPGSLLASFAIAGNANQAFLATDSADDPTYTYAAPVNFTPAGGGTQWLSIVPDLAFPPQWGWESSSSGDGVSYNCFFGDCGTVAGDQAFSLTSPVPEPGSLALLGTGAACLLATLRSRRSL